MMISDSGLLFGATLYIWRDGRPANVNLLPWLGSVTMTTVSLKKKSVQLHRLVWISLDT